MSIVTVVTVPEGIAMAADSRLTGYRNYDNGLTDRFALTDNFQKLFLLNKSQVGISFCGNAFIQDKTIADFLRIFEIDVVSDKDTVIEIAEKLFSYSQQKIINNQTVFYVCGYFNDEQYVYVISNELNQRQNVNENGGSKYRILFNGEYEAIDKLVNGQNPMQINFQFMSLKDAVDLAEFTVEVVIKYQRFEDRVATCGGDIDVLLITKDYARFVKHKILNPV